MRLDEEMVILDHDSRHVGTKCIRCEEEFAENNETVACPRCHKIHHVDCWKAQGGCANYGCPQIAKAIIDTNPRRDGPVPGIPKKYIFTGIGVGIIIILAMIFWPKPPDPAAGRTKVVVLIEASLDEQQELNRIVDNFNDASEDIYILLQTTSVTMLEQQLMVRAAAGDAPDIFSLPYDRFEALLELGAMYALGTEDKPYFAVEHPSKLRTMSIFFATKHPDEAVKVLKYLISEMPEADLSQIKEQIDFSIPATVLDVNRFLSL